MTAVLVHPSDTSVLVTNPSSTTAIAEGGVVELQSGFGIAQTSIPASGTGIVHVEGRFSLPKATGAGTALPIGTRVGWDAANARVTVAATGKRLGRVAVAAATSDTTVTVDLEPGNEVSPALAHKLFEEVSLAGGSKTLDIQDVGKVLNVDGHETNVVTLPATAAGLDYVIRVATDGVRVAVSPNAADRIMGADLAGVDNKDRICAAATSKRGDYIHLQHGGADGWLVLAERGTWTAEA